MINIKRCFRCFLNFFIKIGYVILAIISICLLVNPYFIAQDVCHDNGLVWDYEEKRCREDCYTWQKEYGGCIKMTPEQIACIKRLSSRFCFDTQQMYILCKYNNKAWNHSTDSCRYEFTLKECHKLSGSWEYPDICNK